MLVVSPLRRIDVRPKVEELGAEVIEACRRGDRAALGSFVRCYERLVFAYLSRTLGSHFPIEDIAQEVFIRAYPALERFELTGPAKLSTWLLTIAHRVSVDARRRRRGAFEPIEIQQHKSVLPSPEDCIRQEEMMSVVARAVAQLTPEQRDVFVLATFHELSTLEIAKVVGSFEATVKTRLFRAKAKLQLALGPLFEVTPCHT
jgi:RNA polymerase sigma-70 factor (ECF subfamily)